MSDLSASEPTTPDRAPTADPAEMALVRAASAGDSQAFAQLYRAHASRVYGLCLRLSDGNPARAEQAAQDAFVRAWERLGSFRGDSQFGSWLHRLTVNVVLGERRLLKRWTTFEEALPPESAREPSAPDPDSGLAGDLERALARLPRGARAVLWLHDVEGYLHEEIAELTGIAVGTSKAQLHRARKQMKELLQ